MAALKNILWGLGIVVFLLVVFLPGYTKLQEMRDKNRDLEARVKELKVENYLLEEDLKRVATDPDYREKIAREKMGVVRKGEVPIKIIPEDQESEE